MTKYIIAATLAAFLSIPEATPTGSAASAQQPQLKTYTWVGYAEVKIKRTGQVIVIRDSGSLAAPNFQVGSALAYNRFRYGPVERARGSLTDEVLKCTVNVSGPLP